MSNIYIPTVTIIDATNPARSYYIAHAPTTDGEQASEWVKDTFENWKENHKTAEIVYDHDRGKTMKLRSGNIVIVESHGLGFYPKVTL